MNNPKTAGSLVIPRSNEENACDAARRYVCARDGVMVVLLLDIGSLPVGGSLSRLLSEGSDSAC